ncbi:hypothetical protein [Leptospira idonii]|uniref:Uncharacterized protein n=1 Tax=Leptospira idonii TaxID=1193500 RepID=A0A4R9M276_9LEPT|nr:hypothetical protein [Leptospira idonii]TGN19955.1 hypothetical protein EHS15_06150 [Leptospira idonii]
MVTKVRFFLILFLSLSLYITTSVFSDPTPSDEEDNFKFEPVFIPSPNKQKFEEQISCREDSCIKFNLNKDKKDLSGVWDAFGKNSGKIAIEIDEPKIKIDDPLLEDLVEYLREIAKREGSVSFEPYYIGIRSLGFTDLPLFKDIFGVSYNIYKRLKSYFVFGRMEHYNAKVLYHPQTHDILLIYFFHRNYGNLCDTVYSVCETTQYFDDETFDLQLSKLLTKAEKSGKPIEIKFQQVGAELPQAKLDVNHLLTANRSSRLYKWLIASKEINTKKTKKERFISLNLVVTVLDYTLTAYELVEAIQLYWPARSMKTEVVYDDANDKKQVQSVIFTPIKSN